VRYLWFTSGIMIVAGIVFVAAAPMVNLGPISLVCGLLLIWSGIVKIVVLRIWQKTLTNPTGTSQQVARDRLAQPPRML
jgi:uncharacterized membrane protein HdeD (DUF308 family)